MYRDIIQTNDRFVSINQLMAAIGVSRSTIDRMRKKGDLPAPATKVPLRWRLSDINSYIDNSETK